METVLVLVGGAVAAALLVVLVARVHTTVLEYERGLRYDRGRYTRTLGPGRYWYLGWRTRVDVVDVRPQLVTVAAQEVLTSDLVGLKVSVLARYQIADPARAVNAVDGHEEHLYALLQLALRGIVAATPVEELLVRRDVLGEQLTAAVAVEAETTLGLRLLAADVKDVVFPSELKRTFAQVAAARQEAQAGLERARGETAALRQLANVSAVLERNPALLQLRLLQQLEASSGHTVVVTVGDATRST